MAAAETKIEITVRQTVSADNETIIAKTLPLNILNGIQQINETKL